MKKLNKIKEYGIRKAIRIYLNKQLGITAIEQSIDSIYYLMNHYVDITKLEPAKGSLRDLQKCDALLLELVVLFLERKGYKYWINYGTLLGARRHLGFIPWDDDLDITLLREDFDAAKAELPAFAEKYGLEFRFHLKDEYSACCALGYQHEKTGVWLDIFPADISYKDCSISEMTRDVRNYKKAYHKLKFKDDDSQVAQLRESYLMTKNNSQNPTYVCLFPEYPYREIVIPYKYVFPLGKATFEEKQYASPCMIDKYLESVYGENYMQFPRSGMEHHGRECALSERANKHGIDMSVIAKELSLKVLNYAKEKS